MFIIIIKLVSHEWCNFPRRCDTSTGSSTIHCPSDVYKSAALNGAFMRAEEINLPRCKGPLGVRKWAGFLHVEMDQQTALGSSSRPLVVKLTVVSSSFEDLGSVGRSRVMLLAIAALLSTLVVLHFHRAIQRRRNLPPGPWPWPILGNLPDMGMASKELPHRYFGALADKFGGLMYLQLGMIDTEIVSSPILSWMDQFVIGHEVWASESRVYI